MNNEDASRRVGATTGYVAVVGVLGAIAALLMFIEFPLPIAPPFYKLDFSEVPVLTGSFALGPAAGVLIELIKILVRFIIRGSETAGVGELASFIIGCSFAVPAGLIYRIRKDRGGALIGMICGTLVMTAAGCLVNAFILLPFYSNAFHMDMAELVKMGTAVNSRVTNVMTFVLLCVAPFNLIKGAVVSFVTFLLYKRISPVIHRARRDVSTY